MQQSTCKKTKDLLSAVIVHYIARCKYYKLFRSDKAARCRLRSRSSDYRDQDASLSKLPLSLAKSARPGFQYGTVRDISFPVKLHYSPAFFTLTLSLNKFVARGQPKSKGVTRLTDRLWIKVMIYIKRRYYTVWTRRSPGYFIVRYIRYNEALFYPVQKRRRTSVIMEISRIIYAFSA